MDIVINASPLILLNKINRLYLLDELFDAVKRTRRKDDYNGNSQY